MTRGDNRPDILIVTSAHWEGDARLNRHLRFLGEAGHSCRLVSKSDRPRPIAAISAMRLIAGTPAAVVILPDPELFVLGALVARLWGRRPVIDIHEDYPKTAAERPWIPDLLRPLVSLIARVFMVIGRRLAWRVVVAADHLAMPGDRVVPNIPDPSEFDPLDGPRNRELVYVGEVTPARGALDMVDALSHMDEEFILVVVGRVGEDTREAMTRRAARIGVEDRLQLLGRMEHEETWDRAARGLAGLALLQPVPAYLEATATKIWEYMSAGLPPVVSDLPGQSAVVSKISPDLVCSSPEEVAAIATRLADDSDLHARLVARGRAFAEEEWSRARPDRAIQEAVKP